MADIKEGIGWLLRHRYLRLLALMGLVLGLLDEAVFAVFAVFVLYAQDVLGLTASYSRSARWAGSSGASS